MSGVEPAHYQQIDVDGREVAARGERRVGDRIIAGVEYAPITKFDQSHHRARDMSRLAEGRAPFAERNLLSITDACDDGVEQPALE